MTSLVLGLLSLFLVCVLGSDLCKEREWFDDKTGRCRPCTVCTKKWELAPCVEFEDTMCVDLSVIALKTHVDEQRVPHRWHEMEGKEAEVEPVGEKVADSNFFKNFESFWGQVMLVALCLSFVTVTLLVVFLTIRYLGKASTRKARGRLFSRDRLNTTEFMNNLAMLDRRLAIDEILEKRQRATFEPQLLAEHPYLDEVYVDISGLPKDEHEYEELDHKKCLLQLRGQK